ncbi:hypothetical protein L484_014742 [Morus notabilis]|uniref:Uncharacterized protein n=1 Tax=Morus notabilis TaxID=981085 RepID=W9QEV6_9ROSA|nr:hypothetical protein L484_014742 [Morus notabilis]
MIDVTIAIPKKHLPCQSHNCVEGFRARILHKQANSGEENHNGEPAWLKLEQSRGMPRPSGQML